MHCQTKAGQRALRAALDRISVAPNITRPVPSPSSSPPKNSVAGEPCDSAVAWRMPTTIPGDCCQWLTLSRANRSGLVPVAALA
jgi:hypothetical protein